MHALHHLLSGLPSLVPAVLAGAVAEGYPERANDDVDDS